MTSLPRLIGITGLAGAGKTTLANGLVPALGETCEPYAHIPFAKPIKDMLTALGLNEAQLYGDQKEKPCKILGGQTPRHAMQTLGTEWGRILIDTDLWVNVWKERVSTCLGRYKNSRVVADDLRFPSEVAAVRSLGGEVWFVHRKDGQASRMATRDHASEIMAASTIMLDADRVFVNDGTIFDLWSQVHAEMSC